MADKATIRKRAKNRKKKFALTALLPMARVGRAGSITVDSIRPSNQTLLFNVGGTRFEVYRSTLYRLPFSPLADDKLMKRHFRPDKGDYFFDRDPDVFKAVLNYLRVGELHVPRGLCGAAVKHELQYWGLEEAEIAECCWGPYSDWSSKLEVLQRLSRDQMAALEQTPPEVLLETEAEVTSGSWAERLRQRGWRFLTSPQSSRLARVYSSLCLGFVCLSIFLFVAQTHPAFHLPPGTPPGPPLNSSLPAANATSYSSGNGTNITSVTAQAPPTTSAPGHWKAGSEVKGHAAVHPALLVLDLCCLLFFLLDFLLRLVLAPRPRLVHLLRPLTLMDALALIPDIVELLYFLFHGMTLTPEGSVTSVVTFFHVFRLLRVFRLMRHFPALWILFYTFKAGLYELLLLLLFLAVGMLVFGTLIFHADDQEVFQNIPLACWWAIVTMTTVGYGDFYPTSNWGYLVGAMTGVAGLMMIGFTVPVLVENFLLFYSHTKSTAQLQRQRAKIAAHKLGTAKGRPLRQTDKPDVNGNQASEERVLTSRAGNDVTPSPADVIRAAGGAGSREDLGTEDVWGIPLREIHPPTEGGSPLDDVPESPPCASPDPPSPSAPLLSSL